MGKTVTLTGVEDAEGKVGDHVVTIRAMSGRDMMALASDDGNLSEVLTRLGAAVVEHDFGGDILDQPYDTLVLLIPAWRKKTEEDALPQA